MLARSAASTSRMPMRTVFSGGDFGGVAVEVGEGLEAKAEQGGEGHAVDVAGGRGFGSVDVGVGVDPEDADFLAAAAVELGYAGDGTGGNGVVAAEDQGGHAALKGFNDGIAGARADVGYLLEIAGVLRRRRPGFQGFPL